MNEDKLPIKEISSALLATIVEVYSRQDALMNMVVDYLMKKGENEQDLMKTFYEDCEAAKTSMRNQLYAEFGETPILQVLEDVES